MPLILAWNYIPSNQHPLREAMRRACMGVRELGITDPHAILVAAQGHAISADPKMSAEGESPLVILVDLLYDKPERTLAVKRKLAKAIGKAAKKDCAVDMQDVEVFIRTFDPNKEAAWLSKG